MLAAFLAWCRARAEASRARQFADGWNWAAGELLRGVPEQQLNDQIDAGICLDCETAFDKGAIAALRTAQAQAYLDTQLYRPFNPIC